MKDKLLKVLGFIGTAFFFVISIIFGLKARQANKEAEALEKQVDEQKKAMVDKEIEVKNLEFDLETEELNENKEEAKEKIKADIKKKKKELAGDTAKLDKFTKELEEVKVKGEGSIKKVK